jgi:lipase
VRNVNESRVRVNDVELCVFDWPADRDAPTALFVHATGFHARLWDQVIAQLPGVRCIAIDMRGHGRSEKPPPPYRWSAFSADVAELLSAMELEGVVAVGHSFGGYAITQAAALERARFGGLLLVDPVILPLSRYALSFDANSSFVSRRRNRWASPKEMFESFASRAPFASWDREVLRDYVDYGLLPEEDGDGFVLACPPEIEAAVYAGSHGGGEIYDAMALIEVPVRILRARERDEGAPMDMSGSPTTPDLATYFAAAEDVLLPQYSHFMPMEGPAFVARHVRELIERVRNESPATNV